EGAALALLAVSAIGVGSCGFRSTQTEGTGVESSIKPTSLWILNQAGDPNLSDFFDCLLRFSDWNDLAVAYPGALPLALGGQVVAQPGKNGLFPCTANVGSPAYYQCAVDAGHFNIAAGDVLLVVRPDGAIGGIDNSFSTDPT